MTTSTPAQGQGRRPAEIPLVRDRERLLAAAGTGEATHGTAAAETSNGAPGRAVAEVPKEAATIEGAADRRGWWAALTGRRPALAAVAATLAVVPVMILALTRGGDGPEAVTTGDQVRTSSTTLDDAGSALPSPVRPETLPSAVPLPVLPGPIPTAATTPTTEAPTATETPRTRRAPAETNPVTTEIAPATVPPAPEPTAPPTTVPETVPPTTAPPPTAPPDSSTPAPTSLRVVSQGGSVVVDCSGDRVALQGVSVRAGFWPEVQSVGPTEARVRFRSNSHISLVEVGCQNGVADPQVREFGWD